MLRELKIVAFNGPPKSGKDSIANYTLAMLRTTMSDHHVARVSFSLPMRHAIFGLLGLPYSESLYSSLKDQVMPLTNRTLREMMIALSEEHIKPKYGNTFWVKSAMRTLDVRTRIAIVSDLGFGEELRFLDANYGQHNVLVVNTFRNGTTWEGDSRQPLTRPSALLVRNNKSIREAAIAVRNRIKELGWLI